MPEVASRSGRSGSQCRSCELRTFNLAGSLALRPDGSRAAPASAGVEGPASQRLGLDRPSTAQKGWLLQWALCSDRGWLPTLPCQIPLLSAPCFLERSRHRLNVLSRLFSDKSLPLTSNNSPYTYYSLSQLLQFIHPNFLNACSVGLYCHIYRLFP